MKKVKICLGLTYILFLGLFLYLLITKIGFEQLTSYNFLKSSSEYLISFQKNNFILTTIFFILFGVIWLSILQGFGSPLGLICGFIYGPYLGTIIFSFTFTLGASVTFICANFFFKDLIKSKIKNNFKYLTKKVKENQFVAVALLRFLGGIPAQIQNLIPVLFDIKLKSYFFGTLIGVIIQAFIVCYLGAALENQIYTNDTIPSFFEILQSKEVYSPIIAIVFLFIVTFFLRKFFLKK